MIILLLSLLLAGCTIGPSQRPELATFGSVPSSTGTTTPLTPPLGPGGAGQQTDPVRWSACGDVESVDAATGLQFDVDCAAVVIDRRPQGDFGNEAVQLARARAPGVAQDAPEVLVLRGEPGENGRSQVAAVAGDLSPAVRTKFAVITMDLPGTGQSEPIDCLSGFDTASLSSLGVDPTEPAAATALAQLSRSLTFECGDLAGPDLTQISSSSAADVLDAVRSALGRPTLTLIGQGFGATLGAVYADRYPGRVGAAVLDAPADPLNGLDDRATAVAVAAEKSLDTLAANCPAFPGGCPLGSDPREAVQRAVSTLDSAPGAGPGAGMTNGGSVLLTLLLRLGDPEGWPELATALAAAAEGNAAPIGDMLAESLGSAGANGWLNAAIIYGCNDSADRPSAAELSAAVDAVRPQAPLLGPFTVGLVGICSSWPAPDTALGAVKAAGAAPILVAGAVGDPESPYSAVRSLTGQLESATLISWQSGQHGSYPDSACITEAVDAYLLQGQLPGIGSLCPP